LKISNGLYQKNLKNEQGGRQMGKIVQNIEEVALAVEKILIINERRADL
jgi:hypothetical protein